MIYLGNQSVGLNAPENIKDVQVNGTSVVQDGVANVPIASANSAGVVRYASNYGIWHKDAPEEDVIRIAGASVANVKAGVSSYLPICPAAEHAAAFYGLAKAAGVDMASSSNSVGTYTDEAKIAIQKMLGIYEAPWELIREDTVNVANNSNVEISVDSNGNTFELTDIRLLIIISPREADTIITEYGLVVASYNNANKIVASLTGNSTLTIPADQDWIGYYQIETTNGMSKLEVLQYQKTVGRTNMQMPAYYNASSNYIGFSLEKLVFDKISINHVTGTIGYRLYGRRKWD